MNDITPPPTVSPINLKLVRHYIFIDPDCLHCNIHNHPILQKIKRIHSKHYTRNEDVKYWSYRDIAE